MKIAIFEHDLTREDVEVLEDKINDFFPLYDKENSERNYRFIKEILEK